MLRTKIVCTIGPAVDSLDKIIALIEAGMNVARLNFSHGTHEQHARRIENLHEARKRLGVPLAVMLDTKGPEVRIGELLTRKRTLERGNVLTLSGEPLATSESIVPVHPAHILNDLKVGMEVLFNDGYVISRVIEATEAGVLVEVLNQGEIESGKGINIPGAVLSLPAITPQDQADIAFGCQQGIDMVAASFISSAEQVLGLKYELAKQGCADVLVIAKIETARALTVIDDIIQVSDGIMVARGDLGVEVPLTKVPGIQKVLIRKCYDRGRPSITATQMLESMIENARPTRAEASDVANAIYDSTSAVMLSGETAIGRYPIETVSIMAKIVEQSEEDFDYENFMPRAYHTEYGDVRSSVATAAVRTAYRARARAIFVVTSTGRAARLVSRLRPRMPIIALTFSERVYHQLALYWGVIPMHVPQCESIEEAVALISDWALERGLVRYGDTVVVAAGTPFGVSGSTNMMIVETIGDVLVRGQSGSGSRVSGEVKIVFTPGEVKPGTVADKVLVLSKCDDSYLGLLKAARGVILQNAPDDTESERYVLLVARALSLSAIVRADGACTALHDGQEVTLDPIEGLIYNGRLPDD
jgi:pyruvate kinase